jgi:hypothetical protein
MAGEITENNMAINPAGTLPPDLFAQQQELNRQQQMAQLLMQQGQQMPQSQMVSGRYVAPSIFQNLAPLLQTYMGQKMAEKGDKKALDLAAALRQRYGDEVKEFRNIMQGREQLAPEQAGPTQTGQPIPQEMVRGAPNPQAAYDFAASAYNPALQAVGIKKLTPEEFTLAEGAKRFMTMPDGSSREIASGGRKPIQVDTGTAIEFRDANDPTVVLQRIPKSQMPTAGQVVETANGPMIVNTRTGEAQPIMAGGQPLAPKLSSEQSKDITAINQQKSVVDSALQLVKDTPSAFSFVRGAAVALPFGETLAGRRETPEETQARAAVFNIVSKVINERAGAAQSAQEIKRLNAFLPSEFDNATQIENKLKGFNKFLEEQEKGTRIPASRITPPSAPSVFLSEADAQKAFNEGKLKAGQKITINGVTGTWQ